MSIKMYLTYHINCMFALTLIMEIYHNQRADMMNSIEQVQYKTGLIVTTCWQGINREKLYEELGWESLSGRRWLRRLNIFYNISNGLSPPYLADHIPQRSVTNIPSEQGIKTSSVGLKDMKKAFFPFCIKHWNSLDESIRSLPSISRFKTHLLTFVCPPGHPYFGIRDSIGSKRLSEIRVGFSDLRDRIFNHKFNCASPTCKCGIKMKLLSTISYATHATTQ